jgi:hypothetical protein
MNRLRANQVLENICDTYDDDDAGNVSSDEAEDFGYELEDKEPSEIDDESFFNNNDTELNLVSSLTSSSSLLNVLCINREFSIHNRNYHQIIEIIIR